MQIVQPRVRIVVIPPISERIERADNPLLNRCRARLGGNRAVAPCVIGIRAYLGSVFRVDGDDVPLQVLLEVVGVKRIRSIGLVSVLQPDGSAVLIIEVYQEVVRGLRATTALRRPCLGDDLGAVQRVVVDRTAVCLDGSDALGVIREGIQELSHVHGHLHEFATVPLQRIPVVGGGVSDGTILIYRRTDLCQPVAGIIVRLGRGFVTRCARRIRICFLTKPIACVVVGVHVCGRDAVHLRLVRADLPGGAPAAELPVPVTHCPAEAACLPLKKNLMKLQNTIHSKLFKLRAKRVLFLNLIIEDITDCSRVKHIPNLTTI